MLEKSFGLKPLVLKSEVNSRFVYVISKNKINLNLNELKYFKKYETFDKEDLYKINLSYDDWPFIYMPSKVYPITYLSIVILLLISSAFFLRSISLFKFSLIKLLH